MAPPFVHLHVHTDFSMLDGLGKPKDYIARAKKLGMPALAITDHGNMSGAYEFYTGCQDAGIRPIIGEEFYFVPDASVVQDKKKNKDDATEMTKDRYHVVILANNEAGYRTLCDLSSESHRNFYYKPLLDRAMCEALAYEEAENLTVLSGCAASILSRMVMGEIDGDPRRELRWWRETFPNLFVELQHHGTPFDRRLNKRLLRLAHDYKLPWVITNDPHFVMEDDCDVHDALLAVQTASNIEDENRFKFTGEGYWLKSRGEMIDTFRGSYREEVWKEGIRNTARIAKATNLVIPEWDKRTWHIPKYHKVPEGETAQSYIKKLTIKGLKEKGKLSDKKYVKRAKEELGYIEQVGIADFLLITRDIIEKANRKDIWVGPGRGSTAGSLVAWAIGVHKVDSVRYNLLFERFLNPERPKMPDIDTDFSQERRNEVIEDIVAEYGADNVLPVAAFQTMKVRGSFRKLATAMGMPFKELDKWTNIMAEAWGSDEDDDEDEDHIQVENLPDELVETYPELVEYIERVNGTKSAISRHPAGILIFDPTDPIRKLVPEMWVVSSKKMAAQFDLKSAEKMGLMKQDILGLRTGDTIHEHCVKLVKQRTGEELDPDSWIPDEEEGDREVYRMMAQGRNGGVFQIEGGTMAKGIVEVKPRRFEDIVTTTSIYRKGPIMAGSPSRFLKNRKDKTVRVAHESLRPILENTWGEMAYQEQLMQIASDCAGFDQGLVADLLAAVRFKDAKMMAPLKAKFVRGMMRKVGASEAQAVQTWNMMEKQAEYLFNRSHAVAYSLMTYQTARLKRWYTLEYMTALMRSVPPKDKGNKAKRAAYLAECVDLGIKILPPDILLSDTRMTCGGEYEWDSEESDAWMRFGFEDIAGIGGPTAAKIMQARIDHLVEFKSVRDVERVLPPGLVQKLSDSGCLESIGGPKADPHVLEEMVGWQFEDQMSKYRRKYRRDIRLPGKNRYVNVCGEVIEQTQKKIKNGKNKGQAYYTWKIRYAPSQIFAVTVWPDASSVWDTPKGSIVMVEGWWEKEWQNISVSDPDQVRIIRSGRRVAKKAKKAA